MVLVSYSRYGLQNMLNICNSYSTKWRYEYNPLKCVVIVFNESKYIYNKCSRTWSLGDKQILEAENYTHLGINCNKYFNITNSLIDANTKLRGTFFSVVNSGLCPSGINPMTSITIYKSVVLPKALYGCEFWNTMTISDITKLERAHRFCIKYIQNLPPYSRTAIALCSVGLTSIESEIDYKKLQFFSQLCRLPCKYIAKQIFVNRLLRYVNNDKQTQGFIPDIYRIIVKYNLQNVLKTYMHTSCFPTKYEWKRILKHKIYEYDFNLYNEQLSTIIEGGQSSYMFNMLKPCAIWQLCIYDTLT